MIYLDNAATSFPKPPAVGSAIVEFLANSAGNPGRSGHALAVAAQRVVANTRAGLAHFFGVSDPSRIVFALNTTDAINIALWGLLSPGDRVVTTSVEHNAIARPLTALADVGVEVVRAPCAPDGTLDPSDVARLVVEKPTRLVAMTHASNVTGAILPAAEVAAIAHQHGALMLLDAAQTAGVLPIDVGRMQVDLLAFPGHKGLLGPTGTGGLYVAPEVKPRPTRQGGTGTRSEEDRQPDQLPESLESGTVNTVGIAGLAASLEYVTARGLETIAAHERCLTERLLKGLSGIPGLTVHGPRDASRQVATVSITLEGWEPVDLGAALDSSFGVAVRPGLHCAPLAHRTIGTYPRGTVRLSPGPFTTEDEIDGALAALSALAGAA